MSNNKKVEEFERLCVSMECVQCAKMLDMTDGELIAMYGEIEEDELRTSQAILKIIRQAMLKRWGIKQL